MSEDKSSELFVALLVSARLEMPATPARVDCFNHFGVVVLTAVLFETFRLNKGGTSSKVTQNLETQIGLETRSC